MSIFIINIDYTAYYDFALNNNNNDFFCANVLEDQAQWRDKTKGLCNLVIVNNVRVIDGWMKVLGS